MNCSGNNLLSVLNTVPTVRYQIRTVIKKERVDSYSLHYLHEVPYKKTAKKPSKKNIQHFKRWNLWTFSIFLDPGPDTNPQHWKNKKFLTKIVLRFQPDVLNFWSWKGLNLVHERVRSADPKRALLVSQDRRHLFVTPVHTLKERPKQLSKNTSAALFGLDNLDNIIWSYAGKK